MEIIIEYGIILESYNNLINEIDNLTSLDFALEAKGDEEVEKNKRGEKIQEMIYSIIDKVVRSFDELIIKLKNRLRLVIATDKGFFNEFSRAEKNRKPLSNIKVINYTYTPEFLSSQYGKLKKIANDLMGEIKAINVREESELLMNKQDFQKYVLNTLQYKDGDMFSEYLKYVRKEFRGEKKEMVISSNRINDYKNTVNSYQSIHRTLNTDLMNLKSVINNVRTRVRTLVRSQSVSDELKNQYKKQVTNISYFYSLFLSFSNMYFELSIERMLNSRIILKRFYQM